MRPLDHTEGHPRRWTMLGFVLFGQLLVSGSLGSMNLALPAIRDELGVSVEQLQWVVVASQLAYAVVLTSGGRLGDVFGQRRVYTIGLASFVVASLLAAVAPNITTLIVARLLQGAAGGLSSPQILAMVRSTFGPRERPKAFAAFTVVSGTGFMVGQVGAGVLIRSDLFGLGWRAPHLVAAIGASVAVVGCVLTPGDRPATTARHIDVGGAAITAIASVALLFPLIEGRAAGWPASYLLILAAGGVLATAFFRRQRRLTPLGHALVDMRLFELATYRRGLALMVLFSLSAMAPFVVLTYTLQSGFGFDAFETAVYLVGGPILMPIGALLSRRLVDRIGPNVFAVGGALGALSCGALLAVFRMTDGAIHPLALIPAMGLQGLGQGFFVPAITTIAMADVSPSNAGTASGVLQTVSQYVGALGMAIYGAVFFGALGEATTTSAYVDAFTLVLPITLAVFACVMLASRFIPPSDLLPADSAAVREPLAVPPGAPTTGHTGRRHHAAHRDDSTGVRGVP